MIYQIAIYYSNVSKRPQVIYMQPRALENDFNKWAKPLEPVYFPGWYGFG